ANGDLLEKRNRLSYAILNQFSGEYRGVFGPVTVNIGVRAPFFERKLNNYCFTTSASGFVDCLGNDAANAAYALANPYVVDPTTGRVISGYSPPQKRDLKYNKVLPNIGAIYSVTPNVSLFGNYAKGLSVPSTDNLYNSFYFPAFADSAKPKPEVTDSFDGGLRYRTSKIQAQLSGWYTHFTNREASAYDPVLDATVYRNLGTVNKWGVDGSVAYSPVHAFTLYAFGSWMRSKIQDNIQIGTLPAGVTCDTVDPTSVAGIQNCAFTRGKFESGAPKYSYGVSAVGHLADFDLGVTAKRTGPRYVYDVNVPTLTGDIGSGTEIYPSETPAYWLVNLDVRYSLRSWGPDLKNTYLQLNVYNLFDQLYVGGFGGGLNQAFSSRTASGIKIPTYGNPNFVQIGAPRAIVGSVSIGF
ncbi:MAG TPA: TonB-dependent receptor, partial [Sphingomicrobium sp.]|nr:TonB-dependent receptor [Sphingomicrobium sp.]